MLEEYIEFEIRKEYRDYVENVYVKKLWRKLEEKMSFSFSCFIRTSFS